jgi:diguanylate cyclase (GGDEF)-like protein/PAS domain S-box-containing protein
VPALLQSLRVRFVLSVVLIEIVMLSLLVWSNLNTLRNTHAERLQTSADNLVSLFAETSGRYLVSVDYSSLEQYASKVMKKEDLYYLIVLDEDGRQIVHLGNGPGILQQDDKHPLMVSDGVYDVSADISLSGRIRGQVLMGFSLADMNQTIATERSRSLIIAVTAIVLSVIAALVVGYGLTRRLEELVHTTEAVVQGRYDEDLPVDGPEEVRRLTQGFNSMLQTIKNRIAALTSSEERFRSLVDSSPDCVLMMNLVFTVEYISAAGIEMFSLDKAEQVLNQSMVELFPPVSRQQVIKALNAAKTGQVMKQTVMAYDKRGNEHWFDMVLSPVRNAEKAIVSVLGTLRDITDSRAQAAALEHLSFHDTLTDLPNRSLFIERMENVLREAQQENSTVAVLMMDLDRFKEVNDTLGHHVGDQLLKQVAFRLQNALRKNDTIARLGGDEFAVLMPAATEQTAVEHAQKIIEILEQPISLSDLDIQISTSIGAALFPDHGNTGAMLLQRADVAMYYAKRQKSGIAVYSQDTDPHSLRRLTLLGELRHAIDNEELFLQYQPKVDARSRKIVGVEALVRWNHPQHGVMPPLEFIGLAEETGLIRPLTRWVLDTAMHQWSEWNNVGYKIGIAINLSVRNLMDPRLADMIAFQLQRWNVPARYLEMEITESDIMSDPDRALRVLQKLDEMGVKLSIDDFGTGYSSLAYLKQLPVDEIKIDKSFVMGMSEDENDAMIVDATIDLSHKLGLKVVAEGVENEHTLEMLRNLGCDIIQGFYISRPVASGALMDWLKTNHHAA